MEAADYLMFFERYHTLRYPAVSAGFSAADGDDLGQCHVAPAGDAHATSMLCSLANGRVVTVPEVFGIFLLLIHPLGRGIGGLHSMPEMADRDIMESVPFVESRRLRSAHLALQSPDEVHRFRFLG